VLGAGDAGGSGAVHDNFQLADLFSDESYCVDERCTGDDSGAVLVIVKHRYLHGLLQNFFDVEAFGCFDVFEVDAAEGGLEQLAGFDDFVGVVSVELDVEDVDVGEAFEKYTLPFHNGLTGERADVAEAEDGCAVADDGDKISFGGIAIGVKRVFSISRQGMATPGV